jgi:nitrite reductase/ring-hydroxylating ferredoxin subunit
MLPEDTGFVELRRDGRLSLAPASGIFIDWKRQIEPGKRRAADVMLLARAMGGHARMWKSVCRIDEVPAGGMKECAVASGPRVLIVNTGSEFFAYQADCPHEAIPLEQGIHDGSVLTCLEHLWQFDLRTGAPLGDAERGLTGYRLKQEDGALHVWIDDATTAPAS